MTVGAFNNVRVAPRQRVIDLFRKTGQCDTVRVGATALGIDLITTFDDLAGRIAAHVIDLPQDIVGRGYPHLCMPAPSANCLTICFILAALNNNICLVGQHRFRRKHLNLLPAFALTTVPGSADRLRTGRGERQCLLRGNASIAAEVFVCDSAGCGRGDLAVERDGGRAWSRIRSRCGR